MVYVIPMDREATSEKSHLTYETDERNKYDSARKGAFNSGWNQGIDYRNGDEPSIYSEDPALRNLAWDNLGFRLGAIFANVGDDLRERMYEWCKDEWTTRNSEDSLPTTNSCE